MIEKTIIRSTSLDPSKLTRRVNFDLEDVPDTSRRKFSRNVSIDVPSSTEYYKNKQKSHRKSKLKTQSEIIEEEEEDEHKTHSEMLDEDEEMKPKKSTHSEIVDDEDEEASSKIKTHSELVDDDNYENGYREEEVDEDDDISNKSPVYENEKQAGKGFGRNEHFEYKSFLRLRNIFYLALLLRKNPSLCKYRYHYLQEVKRREMSKKSRIQSKTELFNEMFNEKYEKIKQKINWKNFALFRNSDSGGTSSTDTSNNNGDDEESIRSGNNEILRPSVNESLLNRSGRIRTSSL